jgi:pyridinium-3,5-biscarboxylic acid mononucleotide sulfurtransferase
VDDKLSAVASWLQNLDSAAIAVSGGVDSMTLAVIAHRARSGATTMFHAVSPAVPPEATDLIKRYAHSEVWDLVVFDAGEFADADYRSNPVNRCFYCKTHLYGAIADRTTATLLSGTNIDDLGDFRPGLAAAEAFAVRHPYVEVGIDKQTIRRMASDLGLTDVAELPAAPCLGRLLRPEVIRCRLRSEGIVVELDQTTLDALTEPHRRALHDVVHTIWAGDSDRPVMLAPYRRGSAFLRHRIGP